MDEMRKGIFASLVLHLGIMSILLGLPTANRDPGWQTIHVILKSNEEWSGGGGSELKPPPGQKAVPRQHRRRVQPDAVPVPPRTETLPQAAVGQGKAPVTGGLTPSAAGILPLDTARGAGDAPSSGSAGRGDSRGGIADGADEGAERRDGAATALGTAGAPSFLRRELPVYPHLARRLGKEGKVLLALLISATGKLQQVEVIERAGYGFTEAAIDAARRSTYVPAVRDGEKIAARAFLPVRFQLE